MEDIATETAYSPPNGRCSVSASARAYHESGRFDHDGIPQERSPMTINAKRRLDRDGKIVITMPKKRVEATDLGALLAAV